MKEFNKILKDVARLRIVIDHYGLQRAVELKDVIDLGSVPAQLDNFLFGD